jgi:hypothetical protein
MSHKLLPDSFTDLEPLVATWALATETERNQRRLSSTMAEIQAFYDTMMPRMEAVLTYLNQFPLESTPGEPDTLSAETRRLVYLALSVAEVASAVELYKQPAVVDGFDARRFIPDHEKAKR